MLTHMLTRLAGCALPRAERRLVVGNVKNDSSSSYMTSSSPHEIRSRLNHNNDKTLLQRYVVYGQKGTSIPSSGSVEVLIIACLPEHPS